MFISTMKHVGRGLVFDWLDHKGTEMILSFVHFGH